MSNDSKVRLWVTGREMEKNLMYRVTRKEWVKTMKYIDANYKWEMVIIYEKESNLELKRYYNYDNKKTFPESIHEI